MRRHFLVLLAVTATVAVYWNTARRPSEPSNGEMARLLAETSLVRHNLRFPEADGGGRVTAGPGEIIEGTIDLALNVPLASQPILSPETVIGSAYIIVVPRDRIEPLKSVQIDCDDFVSPGDRKSVQGKFAINAPEDTGRYRLIAVWFEESSDTGRTIRSPIGGYLGYPRLGEFELLVRS